MTINGGKPHAVGYAGQTHRIMVDQDGAPYLVGWTNMATAEGANVSLLRSLELRPGWTNARFERVTNKETGE